MQTTFETSLEAPRRLPTFLPKPRVLWSLLFPAARRLWLRKDKHAPGARLRSGNRPYFNWQYGHDRPGLARLYEAGKRDQWDGNKVLDWRRCVDPLNPEVPLIDGNLLPLAEIPAYRRATARQQAEQRHAFVAWLMSQFLHGEQGALFAACEVTSAVEWADAKLYGATQVMDEGRHIEVFHRYLHDKLNKVYAINDNLFTIMDALISDSRWDMKFLGMQIMIEGLALGAFGVLRRHTAEPLLRDMLRYVITDEARHVHFGVAALGEAYAEMSPRERAEREDWAFEVAVLMRNRFLAHEFYDEYYAHVMTRRQWDACALGSRYMACFRDEMFRRLVPNLKRIHLLSPRIRPHYAALGLLRFETEKAATELQPRELWD